MTETQHHSNAKTPTVLIVEDEQNLADLYATWLADSYNVQTAYSGEEALTMLDEAVDVMLLDRRMPGLAGDDVLAELRSQGLDCRVVIVSAVTPDFDVIGMGFDDYLTKPVTGEELHDAVEQMLARAEYDETIQELQQLMTTRATLEAQKSKATLQSTDEYSNLLNRIAELQEEAEATLDEFSDEDFEAAFRDLDPAIVNRSSGDEDTS